MAAADPDTLPYMEFTVLAATITSSASIDNKAER